MLGMVHPVIMRGYGAPYGTRKEREVHTLWYPEGGEVHPAVLPGYTMVGIHPAVHASQYTPWDTPSMPPVDPLRAGWVHSACGVSEKKPWALAGD